MLACVTGLALLAMFFISAAVGVPLPSGVTFDHPTPARLAEFVDRCMSAPAVAA